MRSRLSLFLNDLTLDEILYLGEELERRKEKYRRNYAVLSVLVDKPVLRPANLNDLNTFTREMRRYITGSAASGGGTLLAYSPEVSVLLFNAVVGAHRTCSALLSGLPEFNGRFGSQALRIGIKMGLAAGQDTLAPGSQRCVRASTLVRRANQAAWRSASNTLLMDENSFQEWPEKFAVVPVPLEIEGQHMHRVIPGMLEQESLNYDNEALMNFLRGVSEIGIATLKYHMARLETVELEDEERSASNEGVMRLQFEAYDPQQGCNLTFQERIPAAESSDRMDVIKRILSSMGIALVRYEISASGV
jgi:hypothetical protein